MAHHTKVQKGSQAAGILLLKHDKRDDPETIKSNPDINPEFSALNLHRSLVERTSSEAWEFANEYAQAHAKGGRKLRTNAIVMSMDVVHLPKNWDEVTGGADPAKFFDEVALPFYRARYGYNNCENEVSAEVHFDERHLAANGEWVGEPHLHYKYVPMTSDGRCCHKEVNGRRDLQTLHPDLAAFAEKCGYKGLDIYDPERLKDGRLIKDMADYKRVKEAESQVKASIAILSDQRGEIEAECGTLAARKESLQQDISRIEDDVAAFRAAEAERLAPKSIAADETPEIQRLDAGIEQLEAAIRAEQQTVKQLNESIGTAGSRIELLKTELPRWRSAVAAIARTIDSARSRVKALPGLIRAAFEKLPMKEQLALQIENERKKVATSVPDVSGTRKARKVDTR